MRCSPVACSGTATRCDRCCASPRHQTWAAKGIDVRVLVGEWGYSNAINVSDSQQQTVIHAEVSQALPTVPFLLGTNYWVGPGSSSSGGYTYIFRQESGVWKPRPAASDISAFYAAMNAR